MDLLPSLWDIQGGKAVVGPTDRVAGDRGCHAPGLIDNLENFRYGYSKR